MVIATGVSALLGLTLALLALVPAAGAAGPPRIGSGWTAGVGTASAGLRAEVDPEGLPTTYRFSYLAEAAYQANVGEGKDGFAGALEVPPGADPTLGEGTDFVIAAQTIGPLVPDTAYRYRVRAANGAGVTTGLARRFETEAFATASPLLDGRAWELVSPIDKGGAGIPGPGQSFGGGTIQAAAGGGAISYSSTSSFGAAVAGAPYASQYVSRRSAGGWVTENIAAPTLSGAYGLRPDGVPYELFTADLDRALMREGRCGGEEECPVGYVLRGGGTVFAASPEEPDLRLAGATPDLAHAVLSTCAALTPATEAPLGDGCDPAQPNLYRWSPPGGLNLLNSAPGAALAAPSGAISGDGERVYWVDLSSGDLHLREGPLTRQVDAALGGGGTFETAAADGSVAFLTKGGHLYRFETDGGALLDLTPAGGVEGVLGASASGSHVYYLSAAGLFLRQGAATKLVAAGADASNHPPATGTARVTPSGSHLAFLSAASLTGYDNRDVSSGEPLTQVYLYDAVAERLTCASCNPTGERPDGASTIPGAIANGEGPAATRFRKPANLSDDGRRLFFDSTDALAVTDTAKAADVYEWEASGAGSCRRLEGCLALISRGRSGEGASFLDASASGADVFFLTAASLSNADTGFADIYDAREGGGFAEPLRPIECAGDSCQPLPSAPEDPAPGTLVPSPGNPPLRVAARPRRCKRGAVRRRDHCVRRKARDERGRRRGAVRRDRR